MRHSRWPKSATGSGSPPPRAGNAFSGSRPTGGSSGARRALRLRRGGGGRSEGGGGGAGRFPASERVRESERYESPPHPTFSLRSKVDLSPQAGRGGAPCHVRLPDPHKGDGNVSRGKA